MSRNPEPISLSRHQRREQAIASAWAKGRTLLADGYTIKPTAQAYCWEVIRPGERKAVAPEGGTVTSYYVTFNRGEWQCDCPFHGLYGLCKHSASVRLFLSACIASLSPIWDFSEHAEVMGLQNLTETPAQPIEPALVPGAQIRTASGRTATVLPAERYGRSRWATEKESVAI